MAKKGVEIIVGTLWRNLRRDGMVGLGGMTTELFWDVIYRPAPVSARAAAMLAELRAAPLVQCLQGCRENRYRGAGVN